ncbi:Ig-like domain-containing protein [Eubacterium sp. 1001713B170207_170306_E7]|uniref:Ig-like domain-containing protein n=1 Tax=Eubacterium sp. 1001713B170207_170306_E7 TaxID=2787097 RepID=UPI0018999533|nr:Ig-like domain-containing protein [Eubacterium sp. 1001713B170207_170306_E7]
MKRTKRLIALILVVLLCLSTIPTGIFAEGNTQTVTDEATIQLEENQVDEKSAENAANDIFSVEKNENVLESQEDLTEEEIIQEATEPEASGDNNGLPETSQNKTQENVAVPASDEETIPGKETAVADFTYDTKYDGTLVLTAYTGNAADVVVPSEINGLKVTEIGPWGGTSWATTYKEVVKSVTVPEGVTSIGSGVFKDCPNLTTVDMPSTLMACAGFENCPIKTADGFKKATKLSNLSFKGQPIEDVSALAGCSNLNYFGIENTSMTDLKGVKGIKSLQHISILTVSNNKLTSFDGIEGMNIGTIYASHNAIRNVSALKNSRNLSILWLDNNELKNMSDIKGLEDVAFVREIIFRENRLTSLNGIEKITSLYRVELGDNPDLKDISPLKKLDNLSEVTLSGTSVSAEDQFDLMQIKDQTIRPGSIRTFKGKPETISYQQLQVSVENPEIAELKIASYNNGLEITGKKIGQTKATIAYENSGVTYKKDLTLTVTDGVVPQDFNYKVNNDGQTLTITEYHGPGGIVVFPDKIDGKSVTVIDSLGYNFDRNIITGIIVPEGIKGIGLSTFYGFSNLSSVELPSTLEGQVGFQNCALTDLKGFEKLKKVTSLELSGNKITDISDIPKESKDIYSVNLSGNPVEDITALAQFKNLKIIDLKDTNIAEISALKELYNLFNVNLTNTQVKDVSFFKEFPNLYQLVLDGTLVSDADRLNFVSLSDISVLEGYHAYLETSAPSGVLESQKMLLETSDSEIVRIERDEYSQNYKMTGLKAGETTVVFHYGKEQAAPFKVIVKGIQAVQPVGKPIGELPTVMPESRFALYADGNLWNFGGKTPELIHDKVKEYVQPYQILGEKTYNYSAILDFDNNLLVRDLSQAENKHPNISATEYTKTVENVKEYSRLHALNHKNELFRITGEKISDQVDDYYDIIPGGSVVLGVCYLKEGNLYEKTDAGEKVVASDVKALIKPEGYSLGGYGMYGYITEDNIYYICHWEKQSDNLMSYDYELKIEKCSEQIDAVYDNFFINGEGTSFVAPYGTSWYKPPTGGTVFKISDQKIKVTAYQLTISGSGDVYECHFADDRNHLWKWRTDNGELVLVTDQFDTFVDSGYSYKTKDGKVFTLSGQDVTPPANVLFQGRNFTLKTDHIAYRGDIAVLDKVSQMVGDNKFEEAYAIREDGTIWSLENGPKLYLDGSQKDEDVAVWNMTLTDKASIPKGALQRLVPVFEPANATNQKVDWSSDNEAVAAVDKSGFVTGITTGTAVITAKSEDGEKTASCQVTVIETEKQTIVQDDVQMDVFIPQGAVPEGYSVTMDNTKIPEEEQKTIEEYYKDNYKSIVKFMDLKMADKDGNTISQFNEALTIRIKIDQNIDNLKCLTIVYIMDGGYPQVIPTTITEDGYAVFTTDHFSQYALIETKNENSTTDVQENIPVNISVESVELDKTDAALKIGETTMLTATITPENATNKNVSWTSSDEKVATVKGGVVTALAEGRAAITVTTEDGEKTDVCNVTVSGEKPVTVPVTGVSLDIGKAALKVNETTALTAKITPENATNKNVSWSSSDEKVAAVKGGVVTAVGEGKATIIVTTEDGNKTAECTVTVTKKEEPKPTDPTTPTVKPEDNNPSGGNGTKTDTTVQTAAQNNGSNPGTALTNQEKTSTLLVMCTVTALCGLAIFSIKRKQTK